MNILQIMPIPLQGTDSIPLELPKVPHRADSFRSPQIVGMALVEDEEDGSRSIEWVTWFPAARMIPATRQIEITGRYFRRF